MGACGSWGVRWAAFLFALAVLTAVRAGHAGVPDPSLQVARSLLAEGQPRRAAMLLEPQVSAHPDRPGPRRLLLRALAAVGVCGDVSVHVAALEWVGADDPSVHLDVGRCAEAIGAWDEAQEAYRHAMAGSVDGAFGALALADLALRLGDLDGAREGVSALHEAGRWESVAWLRARWAVRMGSDHAEPAVAVLPASPARRLVEAERDGLAGDCAPLVVLYREDRDDIERLARLAECLRQRGEAEEAWALLSPQGAGVRTVHPLVSAVRVRVAVDRGDLLGALDGLGGLGDREVDVVMSRWYLGYALGGTAFSGGQDAWARHPLLRHRDPRALLPER